MILTNVNLHKSGLLSIIKRSSRSVASGLQKFRSSVMFFFRAESYRPTVITELAAFTLINFYDFKVIFLWKKSTLVVAIPYPWGYPTALIGIKWVNNDVNYETVSHEFEFRWGLFHFLPFQNKIKIYYCSHIVKFLNSKQMKSFRL